MIFGVFAPFFEICSVTSCNRYFALCIANVGLLQSRFSIRSDKLIEGQKYQVDCLTRSHTRVLVVIVGNFFQFLTENLSKNSFWGQIMWTNRLGFSSSSSLSTQLENRELHKGPFTCLDSSSLLGLMSSEVSFSKRYSHTKHTLQVCCFPLLLLGT